MTLRALHDVPAPAKLNLFLHVVGRRADGYHLLESLFVLVDWADRLHFERREDGRLLRHDLRSPESLPAATAALPPDDLCIRAARALAQASGTTLGADIHLDKRVPAGAGMGGGSSDAASTLLALNRLWGLNWPRERLAALGLALGADVPFFVHGENALVEGIGERLRPAVVPSRRYAVVKPEASLGTAEVFGHPALVRDSVRLGESARAAILAGSFEGFEGFGRNDLQPVAEDRCSEVAEAARWLARRFGASRMTGSGSAVFSTLPPEAVSQAVARGFSASGALGPPAAMPGPAAAAPQGLPDLPTGWVGRLCQGLARHPLADWAR
ncbi:MAG: 4-(cytidine 5'-diphospho)-2-C-methyl-D-erythritol kinase [Rubrivivax sp.]|nr:4-(cytidine 5'-diphospho)-2-C-methyl-D-erythritol kinase [Rubrivivax sp.]